MINVFPLQTILLQFLFLLIAIAIEAVILRRWIKITRKTSIDYATAINLINAILGWVSFFVLLNSLPKELKVQVVSYIFFDRFISNPSTFLSINATVIITVVSIFFAAFFIKLIGLYLLQTLLQKPQNDDRAPTEPRHRYPRLSDTVNRGFSSTKSNFGQALAVLLANVCSNSVILLILLLRAFQINSVKL